MAVKNGSETETKHDSLHSSRKKKKKKSKKTVPWWLKRSLFLGGKKGHWHKDMIENWKATK